MHAEPSPPWQFRLLTPARLESKPAILESNQGRLIQSSVGVNPCEELADGDHLRALELLDSGSFRHDPTGQDMADRLGQLAYRRLQPAARRWSLSTGCDQIYDEPNRLLTWTTRTA